MSVTEDVSNINWAFVKLARFISETPYGEITFTSQDGKFINVKTVKSEKPPVDSKALKA